MRRKANKGGCWWLVMTMALTGCTAQMVSTRGSSGVIRYQLAENLHQNQSRRETAYKEMHNYCQGPYRLTAESDREPANVIAEAKNLSWAHKVMMMSTDSYWYMSFRCLSDQPNPTPK
jgi:hypothetical protein